MKPEGYQYFGVLLNEDEEELSPDEQKERKIMKLLLKLKNGTPPPRNLLSFDADEDGGTEQGFQKMKKKTGLGVAHGSAHKIAPSKDRSAPLTVSTITSNVQPQEGEYTKEKLLELQKNTKSLGGSKPQPLAESNKPSETVVVLKGLVKPSGGGNGLGLNEKKLKGEKFRPEKDDVAIPDPLSPGLFWRGSLVFQEQSTVLEK